MKITGNRTANIAAFRIRYACFIKSFLFRTKLHENTCCRGPLCMGSQTYRPTFKEVPCSLFLSAHHVAHRHLNPVSAGAGASDGRPSSKEGCRRSSKEGYRRRDAAVGASAKTARIEPKGGRGFISFVTAHCIRVTSQPGAGRGERRKLHAAWRGTSAGSGVSWVALQRSSPLRPMLQGQLGRRAPCGRPLWTRRWQMMCWASRAVVDPASAHAAEGGNVGCG
jgi:hypothetical protein